MGDGGAPGARSRAVLAGRGGGSRQHRRARHERGLQPRDDDREPARLGLPEDLGKQPSGFTRRMRRDELGPDGVERRAQITLRRDLFQNERHRESHEHRHGFSVARAGLEPPSLSGGYCFCVEVGMQ